jgi:hypothetical protein
LQLKNDKINIMNQNFLRNVAKNIAAKKPITTATKSNFITNIAKNIATSKPIPATTKNMLIKTMQQGKPLPAPIKKALAVKSVLKKIMPAQVAIKKPITTVRQSMPIKSAVMKPMPAQVAIKKPIATVRQSMPIKSAVIKPMPANMTRQINPTLPSNSILNRVSQLIKNTNPSIVKQASPIQRSYMPIDLPYETFTNKKSAMKIPATNFAMTTDIDLVQPPVDGGTFNYYGK